MFDDADRPWADSMPEAFDQWLAPAVFRPFALDLATRVSARRPHRVLELAAGTGVLTRELVSALGAGTVVASDLNPAMVEFGRQHVPDANWRQADAMALPFRAGEFDVVACQFGVMFFPDKPAAFAEVRRVLAPDGVFAFSTWATLETHEFESAVQAALREAFPADPPQFFAGVPHGYADVDVIRADLRAAGLQPVDLALVTRVGSSPPADLAAGYCTGTPVRGAIEARGDLQGTTAFVTAALEARFGTGAVAGRMSAYVVAAEPVR